MTTPVVEVWRPVRMWEERYEVSNLGRVRTLKGYIMRGGQAGRSRAHRSVSLCRNGTALKKYVHQLVAEAFLGPKPFPHAEVRHLQGSAAGDGVDNLAWGTHAENMADMAPLRESLRGEDRSNSKLTDDAVRDIRSSSATHVSLAAKYGVSAGRITLVKQRKIWRHVL